MPSDAPQCLLVHVLVIRRPATRVERMFEINNIMLLRQDPWT